LIVVFRLKNKTFVIILADSTARSIDGQLQRMRQSSLKLLSILSRDDLFRHLLSQIESTRSRQIISTAYWRICFYVLAMAIRLVHQSKIFVLFKIKCKTFCLFSR
jgi:hypothetical protein